MTNEVSEILNTAMCQPSEESIDKLASEMFKMPNITPHVDHVFAKGAYMRCISMKAGTLIISKRHKTQHICVVVSGECDVSSADGVRKFVKGPAIFITEPNTKRAITVHTDSVWMTFHVTDETDLAKIEEQIIKETPK